MRRPESAMCMLGTTGYQQMPKLGIAALSGHICRASSSSQVKKYQGLLSAAFQTEQQQRLPLKVKSGGFKESFTSRTIPAFHGFYRDAVGVRGQGAGGRHAQ